jgi:quercetin dioxygenase-like cupin family protein
MEKFLLSSFVDGWIVGNFFPAILKTSEIEVGVKSFEAGNSEPCHFQLSSTEVTVVITGQVILGGHILTDGDALVIEPGEHASFTAITSSNLLVIKFPSSPADKILCLGCDT